LRTEAIASWTCAAAGITHRAHVGGEVARPDEQDIDAIHRRDRGGIGDAGFVLDLDCQ